MSSPPPATLPFTFTSLVGRERDIDAIANRLASTGGAILTLVGPSGVGKTRLAIAVAERVGSEFELGAVYVDLSTATDASQVVPAIISALGLTEGEGAAGQLARFLADRSVLLVVDNFEQVLDAGPVLNACLAGAPGVRTVVTSQAPLRVWGEQEYSVEPLTLPPPVSAHQASGVDLDALMECPAVELFVTRARFVRPGFRLTDTNAAAVVAICRYLDGLPLAIELAAARSNVLSPEALLNRLSASLQLLSGGPRDAPDRHQALRAAIEWSYSLLKSQEALLLDRLSVFSGSFSLAAAEAIAGNAEIVFEPSMYHDGSHGLPVDDDLLDWSQVLELLDGLVDHSLVQRVDSPDQDPRFRLFQTIRQHGAAKLVARGDTERTLRRHAVWYRALAEQAWMANGVPKLESLWLDDIDLNYDNVRAALDFLSDDDPVTASTFAASLVWYYYIRGRRMEGLRAMQRVAGSYDRRCVSPMARARTDFAHGNLLTLFPQTRDEGVALLESVLEDLRALNNGWGAGYTLLALAVMAEDDGHYEQALAYIDQCLPLLIEVDDEPTLANVQYHRAVSYLGLGELEVARSLVTPVSTAPIEIAGLNVAYALHLLGMIELAEGRQGEAARHMLDAIDFSMHYGMLASVNEMIDMTATLLEPVGDPELVIRLFGAADRLNRESANPITLPEVAYYDRARERARAAVPAGRYNELLAAGAAMSLEESFELARKTLLTLADIAPQSTMPSPADTEAKTATLTRRELEVLQLVAQGKSDREIGDILFISHGTARTHVRNILGKLEVRSRTAATSIAHREGLVESEAPSPIP